MAGRLITFEGIDGVGKTTHVVLLVEYLASQGLTVSTYREPGATELGEELRQLLKQGLAHSPLSEMMLFCAARAELVGTRVVPDLQAGTWVVLDRFTESTLAYQGALGRIPESMLRSVCMAAAGGLKSDLTLWLDLEPGCAFRRRYPLAQALDAGSCAGEPTEMDAIEQRSLQYFAHVRARYSALWEAEPHRIVRLDASGSVEETAAAVRQKVAERLKEWKHG